VTTLTAMERLVVAMVVVAVATFVAAAVGRRRGPDAPVRSTGSLPTQIDRADFDSPHTAWLVVVFTSETCSVCASVVAKASVLASDDVAVQQVSFEHQRNLQERYAIDSVPALVMADDRGAVHYGHVGPVTATDLWATMAEVREPGSVGSAEGCRRDHRTDHDIAG
jgi:thioredoxin-related protein